jgi:sulfite reductase beta subunit-like hemoprotein
MKFDPAMSEIEHVKQAKDPLDVWDDIHRYAKAGFASIPKDDFARMRWYGIYQQKPNEGHFMWRIKLPGGRVTPQQLREIGKLANEYGRGFGDVTTRQDIQLHWMTIENFPDALDRIYNKVGLYTDFACGDTPRNVCSCPLDGLVKNEIVELGRLVQQLSDQFRAGGKEFSNLPRKFKTSVAACPLHCHQPQINDIGVFGVIRADGSRGLGVMVGGGLSSTPHYAQSLRVFIPQDKIAAQVPQVFRHIAHIFRDADELRYKRKRARMKFLVADKGWRWFRDELEARLGYQLEHDDSIVNPRGALHTDHTGIGEQNDGLYYVGIPIERGRWTGNQMIAVADLAQRYAASGKGQIRLSQKQNVILVNIPKENVEALTRELENVGLTPHAPLWRQNLVSCTGTQFCNLAVVETKERARQLLQYLEEEVELDSPIMVSVTGCPNACAQYQIADIGLTGTKAIYNGQKMDAYDVLVGGCLGENPEFGVEVLQKVPTPVVHKVIAAIVEGYKVNRLESLDGDVETFRDFIARTDVEQIKSLAKIPDWTPPPPREKRVPAAAAAAAAV